MLSQRCFLNWILLKQFFLLFLLTQRDGRPVYPGQKSVSFLNNNIGPKVSSSINGTCHIIKVSAVCFIELITPMYFSDEGFLKGEDPKDAECLAALCPLEVSLKKY